MATITRPSHFDFLLDLQNQWIIGIIAFFILSLLFGMAFGSQPDWPFTVGWIVCGIFVLIFITQAFPDVWNYTFWLVGIYILSSLALVSFLIFQDEYGVIITVLGVLSEVTSIGIAFYLVLHFKQIRDEVSGIKDQDADYIELFKEGRYVPLGLWSLAIFMFWLFTNLSILSWYNWAAEGLSIGFYIGTELLLLFLGLYILWVPQTNFRWSAASPRTQTLSRPLKSIVVSRIPKTVARSSLVKITSCPICGHGLNIEKRTCPNCGRPAEFYWCPRSEVFIKNCPNCSKPVSFNAQSCSYCDHKLTPTVSCSSCNAVNRIRDWKRS
jgi:hypothetical protein